MRLERLTTNKIKIFLSSDDLFDRGLSKEDIWKDSIKWHQLFHDMLEEACEEFDVDIQGSVAVEVFSLQAQGMILILTMEDNDEGDEILFDGFVEMQVTVDGNDDVIFEFDTFEDIIQLSKRLNNMNIQGGTVLAHQDRYYFLMEEKETAVLERAASMLSEYGNPSILSRHVLFEYGKIIMKNNAVETILHFFK